MYVHNHTNHTQVLPSHITNETFIKDSKMSTYCYNLALMHVKYCCSYEVV